MSIGEMPMSPDALSEELERVKHVAASIVSVVTTSTRHAVSLTGRNYYADKFHALSTQLRSIEKLLRIPVGRLGIASELVEQAWLALDVLIDPAFSLSEKIDAHRELVHFVDGYVLPATVLWDEPIPSGEEPVIASAVVKGTRGYIEKIVLYANGCYVNRYFDPCAVMIRRLIETLIIRVYEHAGRAVEIKDSDGNFHMLSVLINTIMADKSFNLARDTKSVLPKLKELGDRSAHNRHYIATRNDIDNVLSGLRVAVEDLLHIGGLR